MIFVYLCLFVLFFSRAFSKFIPTICFFFSWFKTKKKLFLCIVQAVFFSIDICYGSKLISVFTQSWYIFIKSKNIAKQLLEFRIRKNFIKRYPHKKARKTITKICYRQKQPNWAKGFKIGRKIVSGTLHWCWK